MNQALVTNKERKQDDIHIDSEFGLNAKAIEELTKQLDVRHLARVALVAWATLLFALFTLIVTVRAALSFF